MDMVILQSMILTKVTFQLDMLREDDPPRDEANRTLS